MFPLYQLVFALLLCWLSLPVLAQQPLARARQRSYLTKIFRLTQAQTRQLFARGLGAARPDFFRVPVDSFPTDSALAYQAHPRPLPPGYYLVAHTEGPQLVYWLRAETGRTLEVLDNQTDLVLVLRDSLGGLVPNAQVKLRRRTVPYDAATRTYRLAGAGRAGLVAVTQGGRTTFHPLAWQNAYALSSYARAHWLRRVGYRALYGFPLGYLSLPVRRTVQDLHHASTADFGLLGLLRSPFNEDVRDERHSQRVQRRWRGYLLLSQPRYRPTGDTLRLKARVLRRGSGRPCTRPLTLWLSGGGLSRAKRLAELRPVRPGTYEYTLPLTDTLGLRADTRPMLELEDRRGATLLSESFQYEDYELKNSHYTLRLLHEEPRRGQPQAVFVRGTDANNLNLLDARVQLTVVPVAPPGALPGRRLFVADTLWTHAQVLDPVGETRIDLPARIFPNADFSYQVLATLLTSDNERRTEHRQAVYHRDAGRLLLTFSADTLQASYDSLGRRVPHRAWLEIMPGNGQRPRAPERVTLPLARPLDPLAAAYVLRDDAGRTTRLYLAPDNASLQLQSDRTADSVHLRVDNPRRLPFWYFVYRGQALRYRGYGTAYALDLKDASDEPWHVSLHYRWGAAMRAAEYTVAAPQRQLVITTTQPDVAYPGQRLRLGFAVTDEAGRPVPDADLAAYAYTSKFEASTPPALPSYAQPVAGRRSRRRFALRAGLANDASQAGRQRLDWSRWQHQLGLDSLQFYHFLYPETGTFFEYCPAPGGLTQVAPFVVDSGRVQPPVAFYIDEQPAYIEALGNQQPYAAVAEPGPHTLRLRLPTRDITLRDVYLQPGHKLTLSIDPRHPCRELTVAPRPAQLTPTEDLGLRRAIVTVREEPGTVALRQGSALRLLGQPTYRGMRLAGPFRPDSLQLLRLNGATSRFLFEPLYDYTFYARTIKQSCLEPSTLGYLNGTAGHNWLPLGDFALTPNYLQHLREPAFVYRPRLLTPAPQGSSRLVLRLPYDLPPGTQLAAPLYTLLTRPDQPKFSRLGYGLEPMAGLAPARYQVAVLLADSTSLQLAEPVLVEANGTTYVQLRWTDRRPGEALRRRIEQLFAGLAMQLAPNEPPARRETRVEQPGSPRPDWRTLVGRVTDARGEGLPGVTVLAKNTTFGTSTNVDGYYALQVPPQVAELVFSYIGYARQELLIGNHSVLNTSLVEDAQQLNEVVVVGYGTQQRANLTGAVATMLQGRVAGVSISGQPAIRIRGTRSVAASSPPLLIVNGLPFSGDLSEISPQDILDTKVLKGEAATGIYGARGANGVILITTRTGATFRSGAAGAAPELLPGADPRLSLRRHFRDNAWWRPTLLTDALGQAHTDVVLPDDVTGWDTFVVGSDGHGRVGGLAGRLRSFKALRAELAVPRFLVAGDRVQALGKVLNYQGDTAAVTTSFRQGSQVLRQQARRVATSSLDTLTFTAPPAQLAGPPDSLEITFGLSQASGYADGEQRRLPVLPAGTTEQVGTFSSLLPADTTVRLPLDPRLGPATVRIERDALPVLLAEIEHLEQYAYLCNEQMASRLQGLLLERRIRAAQGQPFRKQRNVNFLIRRLLAGRHQPEGLWGTWPASAVSPWATLHVVEALQAAGEAGFAVSFNRDEVVKYLLAELDATLHPRPAAPANRPTTTLTRGYFFAAPDDQIRLLHLLHALHAPADYPTYLRRLEQQLATPRLPLDRYLALTELRQKLALPYQLDTLRRYRLRTMLGGALYADTLHAPSYFRYLLPDRVGTTLLAYRVLRTQGGHDAELARLLAYLLGLRGGGYWLSTYQTAQILATIGPDLLVGGPASTATQVTLGGAPELPSGPQTQFPLALKLPTAPATVIIHKTGPLPVYATAYQTRWLPRPEAATKPFTVTTTLGGQTGRRVQLPAGRPAELVVTVNAPAESRYVLLEVPIPAGCSYGDPAPTSFVEVHREYLKQQVGIFIDYLPTGRHTFRVALQPRYCGQYTLNPARAELLYFPTKFGRAASKQVQIR